MNHLTAEQISELTAELDRVVRKLERSMRTTEEALRPVQLDQTAVGRLSRIDSLQNQGLTRNLHEREQAKLGQVVTAFQRIEAGTYGLCVECGGEIPFERLQVFPETPTCTACGA
ncbi:MAG TPA: TraR/DksA family transcriptional regulator [Longimicrobiales bacterium]|nr:TraR/DksA family transcriptional regulator [Longimicrobiales bacterium]